MLIDIGGMDLKEALPSPEGALLPSPVELVVSCPLGTSLINLGISTHHPQRV